MLAMVLTCACTTVVGYSTGDRGVAKVLTLACTLVDIYSTAWPVQS